MGANCCSGGNCSVSQAATCPGGTTTAAARCLNDESLLFWGTIEHLYRFNLETNELETFPTIVGDIMAGAAVDPIRRKLWISVYSENIYQMEFDGTSAVLMSNSRAAHQIALDLVHGHVYWGAFGLRQIRRMDLNGDSEEIILDEPAGDIENLAVHPWKEKIYFAVQNDLKRANLDGTNVEVLYTTEFTDQRVDAVAVDTGGEYLYWADSGVIRRASLDGENIIDVFTGVEHPIGMVVDAWGGKIYWSEPGIAIHRVNLDGTNPETVTTEGFLGFALHREVSDCNNNGVDDVCEGMQDCNFNGIGDRCDVSAAISLDCNRNFKPDECEPQTDCDSNGVKDICDIADQSANDCNWNGIPDPCDIDGGLLEDDNGDDVPDVCQNKSRFLTFAPPPAGTDYAVRLKFIDLHLFGSMNGEVRWLNAPGVFNNGIGAGTFWASSVGCDAALHQWPATAEVSVYGAAIVPDSEYEVRFADAACLALGEESCMTSAITLKTTRWADVLDPFYGFPSTNQPNPRDFAAIIAKFKDLAGSLHFTRARIAGNDLDPSGHVSFMDISACVSSHQGLPYPYAGPAACP